MTRPRAVDEPTPCDLRLLKAARKVASDVLANADAHRERIRRNAFRAEIGATVRSVSPVLLSLLENNGLSLDEIVWRMVPPTNWPVDPRIAGKAATRLPRHHFLRYATVCRFPNDRLTSARSSITLPTDCGGWMALRVEAHTIEVSACLGDAMFFTRFGSMDVRLPDGIPATLAAAAPGRALEEVIGHPALDGRGWRIVACVVEPDPGRGTTLGVETGAACYRLPWAR